MEQLSVIGDLNQFLGMPFKISEQNQEKVKELKDYIFGRFDQWETKMSGLFDEMNEGANSWRMIPRITSGKRPQGLFNSKSGETSRAVNTLATIWFRMMTAQDPYFEAVAEGTDEMGNTIDETELYGIEQTLLKQLTYSQYKRKLLKSLRSLAAFGTVVIEEPFVVKSNIEYTDFNNRSMLLTAYDPFIFDLYESDFIGFIDFPTIFRMRQIALDSPDTWDIDQIEKAIKEYSDSMQKNQSGSSYARVVSRKQRAGYYGDSGNDVNQLMTYHGKLPIDNEIVQAYWASIGTPGDIRKTDWTVSFFGDQMVRFHHTPYGDWHHHVKIAHVNEFELEPIGYGVSKIGKKPQRELDVTQSRMSDILMFSLFSMWKISKYAGFKANQFNIKPWNIIELEDITQMEPIKPDYQAIQQALAMQAILKEDFRTTTGASTNLQAVQTNATATEASLTQGEAIRSASVNAEVIAETLVREHITTCHINNTDLMDKEIPVNMTSNRGAFIKRYNRFNLPRSIGFQVKVVSDKDYRPERQKNILQGIQLGTSIRNMMPNSINFVRPLVEEWFRSVGLNPRLLRQPIPMADQVIDFVRRKQLMSGGASANGGAANEIKGEVGDEMSGFPNVDQSQGQSAPGGTDGTGF